MQEQVEDQGLAGLAHVRVVATRPAASTDPTVLAPVPSPLDCPYLHLDDDGPACLALAPAIRLSRRQVELVCAVAAHVACPRLIKADAGRAPAAIEPPPAIDRHRDRRPLEPADPTGLADGGGLAATGGQATTPEPTARPRPARTPPASPPRRRHGGPGPHPLPRPRTVRPPPPGTSGDGSRPR